VYADDVGAVFHAFFGPGAGIVHDALEGLSQGRSDLFFARVVIYHFQRDEGLMGEGALKGVEIVGVLPAHQDFLGAQGNFVDFAAVFHGWDLKGQDATS